MDRSPSRIQEAEGAMDRERCPSSVQPSVTQVSGPHHALSPTSDRADAVHVTISPRFNAPVPTRKYRVRVNKESHKTITSWQQDGESLLDQVVEQERLAWLMEAPGYSGQKQSRSETSKSPTDSFGHEENNSADESQAKDTNLSWSSQSQPSRRSLFLEGSMNEGSKATASTWHNTQAFTVQASDTESEDESELTPRQSPDGSRRSSIDINEFKPLPATPSAFRATIKAFGQKLKQRDSACSSPVKRSIPDSHEKERKRPQQHRRRGLRKSVTSWKIFNNSTSDAESAMTRDVETGDDNSVKTNNTARMLRSMISKPRVKSDSPQKATLDDRKRKAEIAYAEQFGTASKKQKQEVIPPESSFAPILTTTPTTVRRRTPTRPAVKNTTQSAVRRNSQASDAQSHSSSRIQLPAPMVEPLDPEPLSQIPHSHSNSKASGRGLNSGTDRLKRTSRSKLEKENQQLRGLLRESQDQAYVRRSASQSRKATGTRTILPKSDDGSDAPSPSSNWHIYEDDCSSATEAQARGRTRSTYRSESKPPLLTPVASTLPVSETSDCVSPPTPSVPKTQPVRSALSPVGNVQPSYDTATAKHRGVTTRLPHVTELPRALSMVLEGIEDDTDRSIGKDTYNEKEVSSCKRKTRSHDGPMDGENIEREKKFMTMISRSGAVGSKDTQWQWPDDVF